MVYGILKQIRRKKSLRMSYLQDKKRDILTDEKDIIDRCNYFEKLTETNTEDLKRESIHVRDVEKRSITGQETTHAIDTLKIGKAAGRNDITAEILKYMRSETKTIFTGPLNSILRTKVIPQEYRRNTTVV